MELLGQVQRKRRQAGRRLVAAGIAGLVAVAGVGAGVAIATGGDGSPTARSERSVAPSSSPSPTPTAAGIWTPPPVSAGPLLLPKPARTTRGVPVGYPHTTKGAISAAAHYTETAVGLDADRARSVGDVAGAPSYLDAAKDLSRSVVVARQNLGVPEDGPTRGAYLRLQARAYRVTDATPDRVVVSILGTAEGAGPTTGGQGRSSPSVASHTLVWVQGDWRIAGEGDPASSRVPEPGSTQAYEEGWRDLAIA
jgi:hypothetical protein